MACTSFFFIGSSPDRGLLFYYFYVAIMGRKPTSPMLQEAPAKRGRPAARYFLISEAAELSGVKPYLLERMVKAPGSGMWSKSRLNEAGDIELHESDLRRWMGSKIEYFYTVPQVAEIWACDYNWLSRHVKVGNVPSTKLLGQIRIAESVVSQPPEYWIHDIRAAS